MRLVTFLVALQILNFNFFEKDTEQLAYLTSSISPLDDDEDQIDSVFKYISESVVKKIKGKHLNNQKPEKHFQTHKHMVLKMVELHQLEFALHQVDFKVANSVTFMTHYRFQYYKEIATPPLSA